MIASVFQRMFCAAREKRSSTFLSSFPLAGLSGRRLCVCRVMKGWWNAAWPDLSQQRVCRRSFTRSPNNADHSQVRRVKSSHAKLTVLFLFITYFCQILEISLLSSTRYAIKSVFFFIEYLFLLVKVLRLSLIWFVRKEQVSSYPENCRVWKKKRRKEKGKRLREGNFQDKEGGECTCNLTVVKDTPRKECTKTKAKWTSLEGGGGGDWKRERGARSWISSPLPENAPSCSQPGRPREMRKSSRPAHPDSYLVNDQHYRPALLQALWGRKEEEKWRKSGRGRG